MFGNGQTNLADLFGFAIIASIFPNLFGGYGYGNRGGQGGGCQCPSVDGQLALQAVAAQGDASRTAIENLAASMGQNYSTILPAVQNVQAAISQLASANGMGFLQVINALQQGNCNLAGQLQQCCCDNRLLTTQQGYETRIQTIDQTNQLNGTINANGQRQVDAIADLNTTMIKEFCDARERDMQALINQQADEISQLRTKDNSGNNSKPPHNLRGFFKKHRKQKTEIWTIFSDTGLSVSNRRKPRQPPPRRPQKTPAPTTRRWRR